MYDFYMKKLLGIMVLGLLWCNSSMAASIYGSGDIEISKRVFDNIVHYLGSGVKNKKAGAKQRGPGTNFAVSISGNFSRASYCPHVQGCIDTKLKIKRWCETEFEKQFGRKEKCKMMFKGPKLKWNSANIRLSQKDDIEGALARAGITVTGSSYATKKQKAITKKKKETKISKTRTGKRSLAMSWEGYNDLILGSLQFNEKDLVGSLNLKLPNNDGNCKGTYALSTDKGTWSLLCDKNNMSASGTLKWNNKDGSVTGEGKDSKGKKVKFTVQGET